MIDKWPEVSAICAGAASLLKGSLGTTPRPVIGQLGRNILERHRMRHGRR